MMVVPVVNPLTTPVPEPIVATIVLLLDQLPVPVTSFKVIFNPVHTLVGPVIAAGVLLTVMLKT